MKQIILVAMAALSISNQVGAYSITDTLGNGGTLLIDGMTYDLFGPSPNVSEAQAGQIAPFNAGIGSDLFENFSASWSHNIGPQTDTILSVSWELGIYEHDSAAAGSQLASFGFDGNDMTAALDTEFEGSGGGELEYNVYSLSIPTLGDLVDGIANISLALQGPGNETCGLFPPCTTFDFNGAHLIYSTLTVELEEVIDPPPTGLAEPSSLGLALIGMTLFGFARRRRP